MSTTRIARPATPPTTLPTTVGVGGAVLLPVLLLLPPLPAGPPLGELLPPMPVAVARPPASIPVPDELLPMFDDSMADGEDELVDDVEMVLLDDCKDVVDELVTVMPRELERSDAVEDVSDVELEIVFRLIVLVPVNVVLPSKDVNAKTDIY